MRLFWAFVGRSQLSSVGRYSHLRQTPRNLTFLWRHLAVIALSHSVSIEGREERAQLSQVRVSDGHPACGFAVDTPRGNKGVAVLLSSLARPSHVAQESRASDDQGRSDDLGLSGLRVGSMRPYSWCPHEESNSCSGFDGRAIAEQSAAARDANQIIRGRDDVGSRWRVQDLDWANSRDRTQSELIAVVAS
jgi:hypothetical protein